ncbi:MAG: hypothetical protein HY774_01875 [Acidobacteria bacterium]|nr:hypothetical protein [Acidobacteriota bacterium]
MNITCTCNSKLPRLAWCARLRKNADVIEVLHGPWVETQETGFFEGAWDNEFDAFRFDQALMAVGSGARLTADGIVFVAPSHNLEWIQLLRIEDELLVSNSLPFLLMQAGDGLDGGHPFYLFDFLNRYRQGLAVHTKTIPTAHKRQVQIYDGCNLLVRPDLTVQRLEKPQPPPPVTYHEYIQLLQETLNRVSGNAQDKHRQRRYPPVTTISTGYDSTAISVLATQTGCREALTFRQSGDLKQGYLQDSGAQIAGMLGLDVMEFDREEIQNLPSLTDAEFFINPLISTDRGFLVFEDHLTSRLVLTGRNGENYWTTNPDLIFPLLQEPSARLMSGTTLGEYRLRAGFIHFPVPFCGAVHAEPIFQITMSDEMKPWSIGGEYDRPIARRIIEEAGIPRHLFGQVKKGGGNKARPYRLTDRCETDFQAFYESEIRPRFPQPNFDQLESAARYAERDHNHRNWNSPNLFVFHWGFERIKHRYQV